MATKLESDDWSPNTSAPSGGSSEIAPSGKPEVQSAEWSEHEHVSPQVQLEAKKLVDMVGNPELATQAIKGTGKNEEPSSSRESETTVTGKSRYSPAQLSHVFLKSLADLETSFATPVVSGELTEWVTNALRAAERVRSFLLGDIQKIHTELFSNILRQDVDLSAQVEKLRTADVQISHADCDEVISNLTKLQEQARRVRQDEAQIADAVADVTKRGMEFVLAARGQETAISAWLSEAFNRDIGGGD